MTAYLTLAEFKSRTLLPPEFVDEVESVQPGFVLVQAESWSRWIDTRLGKRYATPFDPSIAFPEAVKSWLTRILTLRVWLRRGIDPNDAQYVTIAQDEKEARDEIKEAANSDIGLFDIPLKPSEMGSAIKYGGPKVYSEQSPYVQLDVQRDIAQYQDQNRHGDN